MSKRKWTNEQLIKAVKNSKSIAQVLRTIGLADKGGSYRTIHKYIDLLNLDTSHFTGMLWSKGRNLGSKYPLEDYINNKRFIKSYNLKLRLIKEGIFERKCYRCLNTEWQGRPIPLELEHINGNHKDNSLKNLTLLCPNCHALTPTYRGKNQRRRKK